MKLEEIGFYTLSDDRVRNASMTSPMYRCEILLTDKCNFKCPYCKGVRAECKGPLSLSEVKKTIDCGLPIKNIRFTGGEPTLYPYIKEVVFYAKEKGVERIALSTNGSNKLSLYEELIELGVNDLSISLDACCESFGTKMCGGIEGMWDRVVQNIKDLSKKCYITLGMVFNEETIKTAVDTIEFGSSLGAADIRIISSAQCNKVIPYLERVPREILNRHQILRYRIDHYLNHRNIRGLVETDYHKCALVRDDCMIAGKWHFPCIIYFREGGAPIGEVGENLRKERYDWFLNHDSFKDEICRKNCLDVCIDYNNKYRELCLPK